ncbi:type II toxin-antitoxin system prevent-host-death family antitoxin [Thermus oshimai]|uniref:type II toxin-antitoxin system prevent-host-death family antitoxin n=1 Tax=Thermus oshimai TaxID=56957 RepID=UPI0039A59E05
MPLGLLEERFGTRAVHPLYFTAPRPRGGGPGHLDGRDQPGWSQTVERIWPLQEAKARFSEVVERALRGTPQGVSRRG